MSEEKRAAAFSRSPPAAFERSSLQHISADPAAALAAVRTIATVNTLKADLQRVTDACAQAIERGQSGTVFFLLRKKWQIMQALFEAENELRLLR